MGYVVSGCGGDCLLFHRVIMDCPVGKYIDHIDRNPLNNQSDNLRITTNQINNLNKGLYSTNTSGYTGVVWDKSRSKWMAQFSIGKNKNINLGRYDKIEDAVIAREKFFNSYLREAEKNA